MPEIIHTKPTPKPIPNINGPSVVKSRPMDIRKATKPYNPCVAGRADKIM